MTRKPRKHFHVTYGTSWSDHGIHCWWELIRSKPLFSGPVYLVQVFAGFSGRGNPIYNIIHLLKRNENVHLFPGYWGYENADAYLQSLWEDGALEVTLSYVRVQMELTRHFTRHSRLIGRAITMISWFGIACVRWGPASQW